MTVTGWGVVPIYSNLCNRTGVVESPIEPQNFQTLTSKIFGSEEDNQGESYLSKDLKEGLTVRNHSLKFTRQIEETYIKHSDLGGDSVNSSSSQNSVWRNTSSISRSTNILFLPYHLRNLKKEQQGNFPIFQPMKKGKFIFPKPYINGKEKHPCHVSFHCQEGYIIGHIYGLLERTLCASFTNYVGCSE